MSYGQVNADVIGTSVANSSLGAGNATLMKNKIINGACVIDQRNAGASVSAVNGEYYLDRWSVNSYNGSSTTGIFTIQQNAGSVTPPVGFTNYLGITSSAATSYGANGIYAVTQPIEGFNTADLGWGTANAKTVTLSFWVRSSLTGTFGGSLLNSAFNRSYPFSYTIASANTWQQISVTIAGDTSGTWLTTNGAGIRVYFGFGVGSTYSGTAGSWASAQYHSATGATSVVGTNGATFYITGVQLEVGSSATGFEYRQYGQELALCQRYFYMATRGAGEVGVGWNYTSAQASWIVYFPATMRANPSLFYNNGAYYNFFRNGTNQAISTLYIDTPSTTECTIYNNFEISGTAGMAGVLRSSNSLGYVGFSSEL